MPGATTRWPSPARRCPTVLEVTAWAADGLVMGVRHREYPVEGIQFHPESILTDDGPQMLRNWLAQVEAYRNNYGHVCRRVQCGARRLFL